MLLYLGIGFTLEDDGPLKLASNKWTTCLYYYVHVFKLTVHFDIQKFFARCINLEVLDLQALQKSRRNNPWQGLMTAD